MNEPVTRILKNAQDGELYQNYSPLPNKDNSFDTKTVVLFLCLTVRFVGFVRVKGMIVSSHF